MCGEDWPLLVVEILSPIPVVVRYMLVVLCTRLPLVVMMYAIPWYALGLLNSSEISASICNIMHCTCLCVILRHLRVVGDGSNNSPRICLVINNCEPVMECAGHCNISQVSPVGCVLVVLHDAYGWVHPGAAVGQDLIVSHAIPVDNLCSTCSIRSYSRSLKI